MTLLAAASSFSATEAIVFLAIALVFWLVPAYFCAKIASQKGYNFVLFGILGLFFGLIMLVIVFVMPRREAARIHPAR